MTNSEAAVLHREYEGLADPMSSPRPATPVLGGIVAQHAVESAMLRSARSALVRAPQVSLWQLRRHDDRIAAHLDGLAVAGRDGLDIRKLSLGGLGIGEIFARTVCALEERDDEALERIVELATPGSPAERGLFSATGWVSPSRVRDPVAGWLRSGRPRLLEVAITVCRLHGVDPGPPLRSAMDSEDAGLRACALRAAFDLGRPHPVDRKPEPGAIGDDPVSGRRLLWQLVVNDLERGGDVVRELARSSESEALRKRLVVRCCGWLGDVQFVPWLIQTMADDEFARLAGESFALITGVDLAVNGLHRTAPEGLQYDPEADRVDDVVALSEDDGLAWPDRGLVEAWWQGNARRMPADQCSFMGAPPTIEHCTLVLRRGFQRQRIVAAVRLKHLRRDQPLFNVSAPAWRQQRLLGGQ